ncbi:MAG: SMC-Scp complex subunit ScpB [Phycisphaerales bacterium]
MTDSPHSIDATDATEAARTSADGLASSPVERTDAAMAVPCADASLAQRVEVVLFAADRPLADARLIEVLGLTPSGPTTRSIEAAVEELNRGYAESGRTFRVESVAGGRRVLTTPQFNPLLERLRGERQQARLSPAALETLAIIAYRQPILRAELEAIRGVACGEVLRGLMDRRLVRIAGRAELLGRPMLYGTTREFLHVFGLAGLDDLPRLQEQPPAKRSM